LTCFKGCEDTVTKTLFPHFPLCCSFELATLTTVTNTR